jgi:signal transduction histidine kinase
MRGPDGQLSHHDVFRHSVPIRLAAYWVLAAGCLFFSLVGLYPFPRLPILLVTLLETGVLAATYRGAMASRPMALSYLGAEGLCQTAIFHFCGELRLGVAPIVYTFELLNPGVRLGRAGHFAVANGFAALFAFLVLAEHLGLVALAEPPPWAMASVLVVLLELNVAAVFVSETRRVLEDRAVELAFARDELRSQSADLERRVTARTAEVEASYRALQDQANEHRTFVYTVTHDLKAPLNAILLRADRIDEREGTTLARESRADLSRIKSLAERGEAMLRDLMAHFEVSESPEPPDMVDLATTVRRALEPLESAIASKRLHVQISELPAVWGQPKKLTHVFGNLLSNAVKFTPTAGGRITVESHSDDGNVVICVADNGPGIPAGYERTIFNLFARVPTSDGDAGYAAGPPGTGLGLAIVRRIVEQHHGAVWVESPPGEGSRFYVRLPRRSP